MAREDGRAAGLGVGILYNPSLPGLLRSDIDLIDYLSITPDMFWNDRGPGATPRFSELDSWIDLLDWTAQRRPIVAHTIGLSIASAEFSDPEYVAQLVRWHERYGFRWHSDHLSFAQVRSASGHERHAGMAIPLPYDHEVLDMVAARVRALCEALPSPFLVENNVSYLTFSDQDMSEPEFLNKLVEAGGCGLLLDLHNLYTNARNHGFDANEFLQRLQLDAVVEVHIAGGSEFAGMYTDSHAGACPPEVWALLEEVLPRARNLQGVTFEFHDSYFPTLGESGVREQLRRARELWNLYH